MAALKPHNLIFLVVAAYIGVWAVNAFLRNVNMGAYQA